MKNNALVYSLKVWLTALLLGSLGAGMTLYDKDSHISGLISWLGFVIFYGFFFSFPSFLILFLFVYRLNKKALSVINKKLILSGVGLTLTLLPFFMMIKLGFMDSWSDIFVITPYAIIIVFGIWFYKLNPTTQTD